MKLDPKLLLVGLLAGSALAGLTMVVPYTVCLNGCARGFPFAAYSPDCEASFAAVQVTDNHAIDLAKLASNVVLWTGVALGLQAYTMRRNYKAPR